MQSSQSPLLSEEHPLNLLISLSFPCRSYGFHSELSLVMITLQTGMPSD